eukprot:242684-Pelagomonas_calceolata.AAC.1
MSIAGTLPSLRQLLHPVQMGNLVHVPKRAHTLSSSDAWAVHAGGGDEGGGGGDAAGTGAAAWGERPPSAAANGAAVAAGTLEDGVMATRDGPQNLPRRPVATRGAPWVPSRAPL